MVKKRDQNWLNIVCEQYVGLSWQYKTNEGKDVIEISCGDIMVGFEYNHPSNKDFVYLCDSACTAVIEAVVRAYSQLKFDEEGVAKK